MPVPDVCVQVLDLSSGLTAEATSDGSGAYRIEGRGIQLFERIEGDFFTVVGLPLLAVLAALRDLDAIDG